MIAVFRSPCTKTWALLVVLLATTVGTVHAADKDDVPPGGGFDYENMMRQGQNCNDFKCSSGMVPVPKSRLQFTSSGCGSMGGGSMMMMAGGDEVKEKYEDCCHQWHACIQVCGSNKKVCDETFKSCSAAKCFGDDECKKSADLKIMLVGLGGCKTFDQAQYQACECLESSKAPKQRERLLTRFYEKFGNEEKDTLSKKVSGLIQKADTKAKFANLLNKLITKYPKSIKQVEDPQSSYYKKLMEEASKKTADNKEKDTESSGSGGGGEDDEDDQPVADDSEEHIEL